MNTKAKGNRNEHRTMRLLESQGYRCCRSAASLGEWDVIGIGTHDVQVVQVKSNRPPPKEEMTRLHAFIIPANVRKVLHVWLDGKREPLITYL